MSNPGPNHDCRGKKVRDALFCKKAVALNPSHPEGARAGEDKSPLPQWGRGLG